jgi:hypothetical protein
MNLETNILTIICIAILANLFTHWFEPIQAVKQRFIDLFSFVHPIHSPLDKVLNCPKCFAFWFTLVYTYNIFLASLAAFIGFVIQFFINYIDDYYRR